MKDAQSARSIALLYLARGRGSHALVNILSFREAYRKVPAGIPHSLYVLYKGFCTPDALERARVLFTSIKHRELFVEDLTFDIGAYGQAISSISEQTICFLNTYSQPCCSDWLAKLAYNLSSPRVGLVGASGSFESHTMSEGIFPDFPNIHIRTNAFMMPRRLADEILPSYTISSKVDAYMAESGPDSVTRRVSSRGWIYLVVGADGRGYSPLTWPASGIFRQGTQSNLLVQDNETRRFAAMPWNEKRRAYVAAWGEPDSLSANARRSARAEP